MAAKQNVAAKQNMKEMKKKIKKRTSGTGVHLLSGPGAKQARGERAPKQRSLRERSPKECLPDESLLIRDSLTPELLKPGVLDPSLLNEQLLNHELLNPEQLLSEDHCLQLRRILHELSNTTTGMLMSSGLLCESLQGDARRRYSEQILQAGERGAALVREARQLLHPVEESAGEGCLQREGEITSSRSR